MTQSEIDKIWRSVLDDFNSLIEALKERDQAAVSRITASIQSTFEKAQEDIKGGITLDIEKRGPSEEDSCRDEDDEFYGYEDGVEALERTVEAFDDAFPGASEMLETLERANLTTLYKAS